jgi:PDZ domain-containing protein
MRRRDFITLLGATTLPIVAFAREPDERVRALVGRILRLQAESTADKVAGFMREVENQVSWITQQPWSASTIEQRRFDALRLLRAVPAITEFAQLDPSGKEELRVSRLATDRPSVDPKCFAATPLPAQAEVGGLGIGVTMQGGLIKVVTLINENPATKAGILANDVITALDDEPVQGLTLDQAVQKMRGPVNTRIKLTIVRMGQDKPIEITMTREPIRVPAAPGRDASIDAAASRCPDPSGPADMSKEPKFSVAMAKGVYYGPVYFRRQSEPYMTLSRRGTGPGAGVSVVEINLKFAWDVVSNLRVGAHGVAYMVDADGKLIAHPDLRLVLAHTDLQGLAQVRAAREASSGVAGEPAMLGQDIQGRSVFAAYAPVAGLGWSVLVELPADEAESLAR